MQKSSNRGRPKKSIMIDYKTIADLIGSTEKYVRLADSRGYFDMDDVMSVINYIHMKRLSKECKKKKP